MSGTPTQLWQAFETVSRAVPSNVAIVYGETSLTYSDLRERCVTLANSWRDRAKQNNKIRILISRANPLTTLISVLAAWRLDASAAVLPPCRPQKSLAPYMETLAPDLVVTDDGVTKISAADYAQHTCPGRVSHPCNVRVDCGTEIGGVTDQQHCSAPLRDGSRS